MQLLIIRHAIAEERIAFAVKNKNDDKRPLTQKGSKRMRQVAAGLITQVPKLEYLISSPLTRAVQTANILRDFYPYATRQEADHLRPNAQPEEIIEYLKVLPADAKVALIGHEPNLSHLIAWFCAAGNIGFTHFRKGSACLLSTIGKAAAAQAEIEWMLTPRQLRGLAKNDR